MKFLRNKFLQSIVLLLLSNFIYTDITIDTIINTEEILGVQNCYENKDLNNNNKKATIYQLNNNSTSNTIFIQYRASKAFVVSESIEDDSSILYKGSNSSGSYYLYMNLGKDKYYVSVESNDKNHKICFYSFPDKGNIFTPSKINSNIKKAPYELLSSAKLAYYIDNNDFKKYKIFYSIRFEKKYLDEIKKPKIELEISFTNSERKKEKFEISEWYLKNNYYYAPFYIPKLKFDEKFKDILFCLNIEFKNEKDELFPFDLELIESQEISGEFNLNITSNKNNSLEYPKVYYINIQYNIYDYDRDILFLKSDLNNTYINPIISPNCNISNENSVLIDKNFIDISQSLFKLDNYSKLTKIDLLLIILDEECEKITEKDDIFISFKFLAGYHELIHYQENTSPTTLFNNEKNKMIIKMEHCRTQYFINYFNTNNSSDDRILDIESPIGNMYLHNSKLIEGSSIDDYFNQINKLCIHKFDNSILSGKFNTLSASCPNLGPVLSYIYAHKKNSIQDTISFINQKSLIYIELKNNQYSFIFNNEEKMNEFDFRIRILRTNIKPSYKIDISYDSKTLSLESNKDFQIFKHKANSISKLDIKISSYSETEIQNKGFILEIFKSIDIPENNIIYIDKEVEKDILEMDKTVVFIFDQNEINSAKSKIQFFNTNQGNIKINLCIHRGEGNYPFIIKPICTEDQEKVIIKPRGNLILSYNNPYTNIDNENSVYYVSILSDSRITYSYKYEREINLEENIYFDLNHKGNKIFNLSKPITHKKSMYFQINLCGNKYQNQNLFYTFNNAESIPVKHDIYQEFPLNIIKSYKIEFNNQNGNQKGKFKYSYGPSNLIKTMTKFSKEIFLSKNSENDKLLISFISPFTELVEITIILIAESPDKYEDICALQKFYENHNINAYNNTKIIKETMKVAEDMKNKIEISVKEKEIMDFMNKNVDIYVIVKSIVTNLELVYDIKSQVIDWYKLNRGDIEQNNANKQYICINCGLNEEQKINWDNKNNDETENNNQINNNENNNNPNNLETDNSNSNNDYNNQNNINLNNLKIDNSSNNNDYNNQNNINNINRDNIPSDSNQQLLNNNNNNRFGPFNINTRNFNNNENQTTPKNKNTYQNNTEINKNNQNISNDNNLFNDQNNVNDLISENIRNISALNQSNINNSISEENNNTNLLNKRKHKKEAIQETKKKKKSRKIWYFLLFIIIISCIYYWRNKYNSESSYSKLSKYSYYDF